LHIFFFLNVSYNGVSLMRGQVYRKLGARNHTFSASTLINGVMGRCHHQERMYVSCCCCCLFLWPQKQSLIPYRIHSGKKLYGKYPAPYQTIISSCKLYWSRNASKSREGGSIDVFKIFSPSFEMYMRSFDEVFFIHQCIKIAFAATNTLQYTS